MQHVLNVKYTADGPSFWRTTIGRSPRFAYVRGEVSHKIRSGGVDSPPSSKRRRRHARRISEPPFAGRTRSEKGDKSRLPGQIPVGRRSFSAAASKSGDEISQPARRFERTKNCDTKLDIPLPFLHRTMSAYIDKKRCVLFKSGICK
jgi:hypothetical protein